MMNCLFHLLEHSWMSVSIHLTAFQNRTPLTLQGLSNILSNPPSRSPLSTHRWQIKSCDQEKLLRNAILPLDAEKWSLME